MANEAEVAALVAIINSVDQEHLIDHINTDAVVLDLLDRLGPLNSSRRMERTKWAIGDWLVRLGTRLGGSL